jgi:cathepsin F
MMSTSPLLLLLLCCCVHGAVASDGQEETWRYVEKLREEGLARSKADGVVYSLPSHESPFAAVPRGEFSKRLLPKVSEATMPCDVKPENERRLTDGARRLLASGAVPNNFTWQGKGVLTPAKNQGSTGTCWAFSTTGNIEGQWALKGHKLVGLSEEELSDCDSYDCGVFGGWPCRAYQWVIEAGGLMSEAAYPFCEGTGNCFPCMPRGYNKTFCGPPPEYCNKSQSCHADRKDVVSTISSWHKVSNNEEEIMAELVANGPISVLINADGFPPLQYHHWGVYNPWSCDPTSLDHAVLLVGYGHDGSTPYWEVKNSWGASWGDKGYFKMLRGKGTCGINAAATTSVV